MRPTRLLLPSLAMAGAALLVTPATGDAWTLSGWSLGTGQRDFRVYNNFSDPTANDNQTPHPNFPGAQGATMAIWKGSVEWASAPHGDGDGDPTQPGGLGSGGANFDPTYQGLASGPGNVGDNIHSELGGCSGGTLAFTESFTNGAGWRILYYRCWTWYDGPDVNWPGGGGRYDIQGVATHEYGHATGLGHTGVFGATMTAGTFDGKDARTIESDDIGGIRANYGVASATKPRISDLSWDGQTLTITGTNFSTTNNQVWFTPTGTASNGSPLSVSGLSSSANGTLLSVNPPANAGPGDVLVRRSSGGNASLSQPWPWDPAVTTCPPILRYCSALPTPAGFTAVIDFQGSQSVSANDVTLVCNSAPPGTFGLFYYGPFQASTPGGDGIICVGAPFVRLPPVQANFLGQAYYDYDLTAPPVAGGTITAASTWNFSFWFRQTSPAGYNFSDAIQVRFCP